MDCAQEHRGTNALYDDMVAALKVVFLIFLVCVVWGILLALSLTQFTSPWNERYEPYM